MSEFNVLAFRNVSYGCVHTPKKVISSVLVSNSIVSQAIQSPNVNVCEILCLFVSHCASCTL